MDHILGKEKYQRFEEGLLRIDLVRETTDKCVISLVCSFVLASIIARNLTNQVGPSQKTLVAFTSGVNRA